MVMAPSALTHYHDDHVTLTKNNYPLFHLDSELESGFNTIHHDGKKLAKEMIGAALQKHIQAVDPHDCEPGDEDAFFVADMGEVYRQHLRWKKNLPRVTPHYAVKCNPDPTVLSLLAALGCGFDCASKGEIDQILAMGVDPRRIIYAQPCKTKSFLKHTLKQQVTQMTFDNTDELYKIKEVTPNAELFLRIATDDSASLCRLSQKFGAAMESTQELLQLAHKLGLNIAGVAFHVGSGASDPAAFTKAVGDARSIFDRAAALGFRPHTLDCGGGFTAETFDEMAAALSAALDNDFPAGSGTRIIAEPGRYYTSAAFTLACNVISRRTVAADPTSVNGDEKSYMLYLNDGVYGNFASIIFDHQHPIPQVLSTARCPDGYNYAQKIDMVDSGYTSAASDDELHAGFLRGAQQQHPITYSIWGPTCDGIDVVAPVWRSPELVDIGDWLYFDDMGAYTKCCAMKFNGFTDRHETIYICSEPAAEALLAM